MDLSRRLQLNSASLIAVMALLVVFALLLLGTMSRSVQTVAEEYHELQEVDAALEALAIARRTVLETGLADGAARASVLASLGASRLEVLGFVGVQDEHASAAHSGPDLQHHELERAAGERVVERIDTLIAGLQAIDADAMPDDTALAEIDLLHADLRVLAEGANRLVRGAIASADGALAVAAPGLLALCLAGSVLVVVLSVLQHRWVIGPLRALRHRVRRGVHQHAPPAEQEAISRDLLAEIDRSFQGLLRELDDLYGTMERRIVEKSRELVLSERLASVGYLAAGVAHEINNPLNSILGYSELALRALERAGGHPDERTMESLRVICEETARCRRIVEKLLSLVRQSDAPREPVDMGAVAHEVISMVEAMKQMRDRTFRIDCDVEHPPVVLAREAEMKQVMLNVVVNAAESVKPGGHVRIRCGADRDAVEVEVTDDGCGMDEATLERLFEPFFTTKRGQGASGTGLGLCIVHAIVQDHGGTLQAFSAGIGRGSSMRLRFPLLAEAGGDAVSLAEAAGERGA